ncbi:hypothetical protein F5887DRAFT_968788, partial [Amanita rubescens]
MATSAISRCPQEILEKIFVDCLPNQPEPDRALTPLRLAHVCSWWRTLAFHLPELWRTLYLSLVTKKPSRYDLFFTDDDSRPRVSENTRQLAQLYADHACHHALSLHFEVHSFCRGLGFILTAYAHRLRSLTFHVIPAYTPVDILHPFLNLPDSSVPILHSLHLTWTYSSAIRFNSITTFASAPNLRKLRLSFTPTDAADALLEPTFDSYYFMIPCVSSLLEYFHIQRFLLHFYSPHPSQSQSQSSTHSAVGGIQAGSPNGSVRTRSIPYLKKLGINLGRSGGLFSFDHLDMPQLDTLQLSAKPWTKNERARKFVWDANSSAHAFDWFKNLTTLVVSLRDMSTNVAGLVGVLTLEVYYIENGSDVEMVLKALTKVEAAPQHPPLPKLECVKLQMANTYDLRPASGKTFALVLGDFLTCRWSGGGAPLARLEWCEIGMAFFRRRGAKSFFVDVERVVKPFRAQGMRLNVYESRCAWTCDQMTRDWW